jgi:hypothetical protein
LLVKAAFLFRPHPVPIRIGTDLSSWRGHHHDVLVPLYSYRDGKHQHNKFNGLSSLLVGERRWRSEVTGKKQSYRLT